MSDAVAGGRPKPPKMMFGSRSLGVHILRGVVGAAAFALALRGYYVVGWPALLLLPVALLMWKGCPTCWTAGLFETIAHRRARLREECDCQGGARRGIALPEGNPP
jgi:hypothetical protein